MDRSPSTPGIGILIGALLFWVTSLNGIAAEKLTFVATFQGPHYDMPALAAEEQGFWQRQGLEVQWTPMRGATPAYQALVARSAQMGMSAASSAIQAASRGVPVIVVADLGFAENWAIWVGRDSPIRAGKDLKGAKIGIARLGGASYAYSLVMVKGLGLEKQVKFVAVGSFSARVATLQAGAIDAFAQGLIAAINLKMEGKIREVAQLRPYLPRDWTDLVLFSHKDFVTGKGDTVGRAVKAFLQAISFVEANPEWSVEKLKANFHYSQAAAREVFLMLAYSKDGKINRKAFENVLSFLIEYGIVEKEKAPPLEKLFTTQFTS